MNLKCNKCQKNFTPMEVLNNSNFAWIAVPVNHDGRQTCKHANHVLVEDSKMVVIDKFEPMGQNWEEKSLMKVENLSIRKDPDFFHCWLEGKHFEFKMHGSVTAGTDKKVSVGFQKFAFIIFTRSANFFHPNFYFLFL